MKKEFNEQVQDTEEQRSTQTDSGEFHLHINTSDISNNTNEKFQSQINRVCQLRDLLNHRIAYSLNDLQNC